jgi:tetratricopeptide (TPR) repeat protein
MKTVNPLWDSITQGLPKTPSPDKVLPLPEILKIIQYCLEDGVEQYDLAISLLDTIKHLRTDVEFLNWQAMVEYDAKKYIRSFHSSEKILQYAKNASTLFNAGRAAYKANELDKSEQYLKESMRLDPSDSSTVLDYAVTICTMGDFDGALKIIESIDKTKLDERHAKIVDFNKGWHYIRLNNFSKGIDLLHLGREINIWGSDARNYKKPRWDGTTHPGKTILIVGEGGIGDEVINARFAKIIQDRGMKAVMSTVHKNTTMLSSVTTIDKVFNNDKIDSEEWDYWIPCMDLPYILKIESTDIPSNPYLSVDPHFIEKWKIILGFTNKNKKLKVGIRWMGNPRYELELARTIPPHLFEQLNELDVQMYSFQKNDGIKDLSVPGGVIDISENLNSWEDTMGAMMNMDLIITSCTSVAHVAGALGVKTWVVIPLLPYYTWADMKKESYWYDNVSLYRQKVWKEWNEPFNEVKSDLIKLLETK